MDCMGVNTQVFLNTDSSRFGHEPIDDRLDQLEACIAPFLRRLFIAIWIIGDQVGYQAINGIRDAVRRHGCIVAEEMR